jgi:hypothetical protein
MSSLLASLQSYALFDERDLYLVFVFVFETGSHYVCWPQIHDPPASASLVLGFFFFSGTAGKT